MKSEIAAVSILFLLVGPALAEMAGLAAVIDGDMIEQRVDLSRRTFLAGASVAAITAAISTAGRVHRAYGPKIPEGVDHGGDALETLQ